jgi:hypothetical protein
MAVRFCLVFFLVTMTCLDPAFGQVPEAQYDPFDTTTGFCKSKNQYVDMKSVTHMRGQSIDVSDEKRSFRLTIQGERVAIEEYRAHPAARAYLDVDQLIGGGALDLSLNFATVAGQVGLYWRETHLHRQYRQGLLLFSNSEFTPLCEGIAGSNVIKEQWN